MDLNYSTAELAFRDEVRTWLRGNLPADLKQKVESYQELSKDDLLRWHRILAKKGWVAPDWPTEWGGTGWSVTQRYIFEEECGYAATPPLVAFGLRMCAPVLLRFGTDAQKQRFLPRIYNGDDFWCQGYSEPGSGSDLASLKTRAVRQGDHMFFRQHLRHLGVQLHLAPDQRQETVHQRLETAAAGVAETGVRSHRPRHGAERAVDDFAQVGQRHPPAQP